jgi:hypothetical protein
MTIVPAEPAMLYDTETDQPMQSCVDFPPVTLQTGRNGGFTMGEGVRLQINAVLGSIVVVLGFWMIWGELPPLFAVLVGLVVAGFLLWQSSSVGAVWAWSTMLLGLESLAWPIVTMVQIRMEGSDPTDQQMGLILTAILFGLFSGIFWMTFAYGIFKWTRRRSESSGRSER